MQAKPIPTALEVWTKIKAMSKDLTSREGAQIAALLLSEQSDEAVEAFIECLGFNWKTALGKQALHLPEYVQREQKG